MAEQGLSEIRPYSLGQAAANIEFGQKELEVTPVEVLSQIDGEVTDVQTDVESSGVDKDGNTFATSQKASNSIKAMWLPLNTHRAFPSLIRRGERVMIWRVGDTDKYYWTELGLDDTTRRKDIYTILVPNSSKEGENSRTPSTAYFIEVNTVDKHITISTNKNDGEAYAYMVQLNPGGSNATLCDDAGNYFQLDSKAQKLILKNQSNSEIAIEKNKGWFKTKEEILLETKTLTANVTNFNLKATTYTADVSSYNHTGNSYSVKTSTFTHNGKNVGDSHGHTGVRAGSDTSGPPV